MNLTPTLSCEEREEDEYLQVQFFRLNRNILDASERYVLHVSKVDK